MTVSSIFSQISYKLEKPLDRTRGGMGSGGGGGACASLSLPSKVTRVSPSFSGDPSSPSVEYFPCSYPSALQLGRNALQGTSTSQLFAHSPAVLRRDKLRFTRAQQHWEGNGRWRNLGSPVLSVRVQSSSHASRSTHLPHLRRLHHLKRISTESCQTGTNSEARWGCTDRCL